MILDHHMPGLTGLETLVRLRKGHPRLPVIMTTGLLEPATAELLADIPWVRILMKPYSLEAMKQHLAASLGSGVRPSNIRPRDGGTGHGRTRHAR